MGADDMATAGTKRSAADDKSGRKRGDDDFTLIDRATRKLSTLDVARSALDSARDMLTRRIPETALPVIAPKL